MALDAANVWCRSANYNNSTNFCNVNTSGDANNNNANYSLGVAPISRSQVDRGPSPGAQTYVKGEILPVEQSRNGSLRTLAQTLLAWRGTRLTRFMCRGFMQLSRAQYHNCRRAIF